LALPLFTELSHWKAHTQRITSVLFVDRWSTVVTGSSDGAVRVWTIEGQYIGILMLNFNIARES